MNQSKQGMFLKRVMNIDKLLNRDLTTSVQYFNHGSRSFLLQDTFYRREKTIQDRAPLLTKRLTG